LPLTATSLDPKTYTLEYGDSVRAHKASYLVFSGFTIQATRDAVDITGDCFAQAFQDAITLTGSPTRLTDMPIIGKHWTLYRDSAFGSLGNTTLDRVYDFEFGYTEVYAPHWSAKRANSSFATHVVKNPDPRRASRSSSRRTPTA
jgi:hypothetical protein